MSTILAMGDFLQRHAYANVWCTPNQDKQVIFKPAKISPKGGSWSDIKVMWRRHKLPDATSRFHVYQIGQLHPLLIGLTNKQNQWINLTKVCKDESLIADVYSVTGVQVPRFNVWYRVTQEKNLIIAVKIHDKRKIPFDLDEEDLFIRLYTNEFFNSLRANSPDNVIHTQGIRATSVQDILSFQTALANYRAKTIGHTYCFLNGFAVSNISLVNAAVGDYLEFVFDGSIKKTVEFSVGDLREFSSTMDSAMKFLLHYNDEEKVIDYIDDIDVFLTLPGNNNSYKGVYFHKNSEQAIRNVTHKDYSIHIGMISAYLSLRPELGGVFDNLRVRLHIRNSGYDRPLVFEENRIQDLYKLPDDDIPAVMLGIDANVSVWNVDALESSGYCALMRANLGQITRHDVQKAYGYNAVSKLVGDTPMRAVLDDNVKKVTIPVDLVDRSTAYEYDADGLLLGYYHHFGGSVYAARNAQCDLVEVIYGFADESIQSWWNDRTVPINPDLNYRFYTCDVSNGTVLNNWVDVTDTNQYAIVNGVATWFVDQNLKYTLVRSNANHLAYSFDYHIIDGLFQFSLREYIPSIDAYRNMTVPLGEFDVFLNKKSLIEKLDYIVEFPNITIINKEYLIDPENTAQNITIRHTGFCTNTLQRTLPPDVGFVEWGVLSLNKRYDIREDKVNRIVVDGALYRFDELKYAEEDFDVLVMDARNGAPYAIRDIVVPMNSYLTRESAMQDPTYELRAEAKVIDDEISDYMTLRLPQKEPTLPSAIVSRYKVTSPFFCKIIHDLLSGALWNDRFHEQYSDDWVREICAPYEYLLSVDPISDANLLPDRFVVIHPHELPTYVDLGIYEFRFLNKVHKVYANDRLELSSHVRVELFE